MTASDRNLIRRLLLSYFPEKLITSAGKTMIFYSKFEKFDSETTTEGTRKFYLVLGGNIRVESPSYYQDIKFGRYTGHYENLCHSPANSYKLIFSPHTMVLSFSHQSFKELFSVYF